MLCILNMVNFMIDNLIEKASKYIYDCNLLKGKSRRYKELTKYIKNIDWGLELGEDFNPYKV